MLQQLLQFVQSHKRRKKVQIIATLTKVIIQHFYAPFGSYILHRKRKCFSKKVIFYVWNQQKNKRKVKFKASKQIQENHFLVIFILLSHTFSFQIQNPTSKHSVRVFRFFILSVREHIYSREIISLTILALSDTVECSFIFRFI